MKYLSVITISKTGRPREERQYNVCDSPAVADEFLYLFRCPGLNHQRKTYMTVNYCAWQNVYKLCKCMQSENCYVDNYVI